MLTLDRLREVNIPINASNKPNNFADASRGLHLYNDSVNLLEAIQLVGVVGTATDLSYTVDGNIFNLLSSTGAGTLLPIVTQLHAGLMSKDDKIKLDTALTPTSLVIGDNLVGDGTVSNPLDWPGVSTFGPVIGFGTSGNPLTLLNESITTQYIANGTILFQDWNQNSATTGQVPMWNGTAWVASTIAGLLPSGALGNMLFHNGTTWVPLSLQIETQTNNMGPNINMAALPNTLGPIFVFRNGQLQTHIEDYSRSGQTITFVSSLINLDRITLIYFI